MDDEWGPWVDHDGMGCPCWGAWVESVDAAGTVEQHIAGRIFVDEMGNLVKKPPYVDGSAWTWRSMPTVVFHLRVIRYRIRKPRGMAVLEQLIADIPADRVKVLMQKEGA